MNSGRYCYKLNGEVAPVEETWTLTGPVGGEQQVESRRTAGDVNLEVSAELTAGQVRSCSVSWHSAATPCVEASFEQTVTGVHWNRTVGKSTSEGVINKSLEGEVLLYPLMRIFTGPVISALDALGHEGQVLVPNISRDDEAELLQPDVSHRRVVCEGPDPLENHPDTSSQRWLFIGGQYDETARFWLDEQGMLLRYQWQQSESQFWEVDLV